MMGTDFFRFIAKHGVFLFCCYSSGTVVMRQLDAGGLVTLPLMLLSWAVMFVYLMPVLKCRWSWLSPFSFYEDILRARPTKDCFDKNQRHARDLVVVTMIWALVFGVLKISVRFVQANYHDTPAIISIYRACTDVFWSYAEFSLSAAIVYMLAYATFSTRGLFSKKRTGHNPASLIDEDKK